MIIKLFIYFGNKIAMIDIDNRLFIYDDYFVKLMDAVPLDMNIIKMNYIGEPSEDTISMGFLDDSFNYIVINIINFKIIGRIIIPNVKLYIDKYILCENIIYYPRRDKLHTRRIDKYDPHSFMVFDDVIVFNIGNKAIMENIITGEVIAINIHDEIIKNIYYIRNNVLILTKDGNIYTKNGKLGLEHVTDIMPYAPQRFLYMAGHKIYLYNYDDGEIKKTWDNCSAMYHGFFINDKNEMMTYNGEIISSNVKFPFNYYIRDHIAYIDLDNFAHICKWDKSKNAWNIKMSNKKVYGHTGPMILDINSQFIDVESDSIIFNDCYFMTDALQFSERLGKQLQSPRGADVIFDFY